jgi:hypothetical protein
VTRPSFEECRPTAYSATPPTRSGTATGPTSTSTSGKKVRAALNAIGLAKDALDRTPR